MRFTSFLWIELALAALPLAVRADDTLRPTVLVDLDARVYQSEAEGLTGFALGRLRPGLVFRHDDWFVAKAAVEFASEYPQVLDAFISLRPDPTLTLNIGLSKPPLFWSHREAVETLTFPDVTAVAQALRVNRDLGVGLVWAPNAAPIEVLARVGNGSASFIGNDNAELAYYLGADLILRCDDRGLRLGASGMYEHAQDRIGVSGRTALGFLYYRAPTISGDRWVGEGHLVAWLGALSLIVEAGYADEARSRDDDGNPQTPRVALDSDVSYGLSSEVTWSFGQHRFVERARGALDLALRFERTWFGQGAQGVTASGTTAGVVTAKWWATDFLAVSALATVNAYDVAAIEDPTTTTSWGALLRVSVFAGD